MCASGGHTHVYRIDEVVDGLVEILDLARNLVLVDECIQSAQIDPLHELRLDLVEDSGDL